jgi:hypothetical protein
VWLREIVKEGVTKFSHQIKPCYFYSCSHNQVEIFWEVLVSVILSKTVCMYMFFFRTVTEISYFTVQFQNCWPERDITYCDISTHGWITQQSVARYPTAKRLATEYALRNNRGSGVYSVPCHAEPNCTVRCYTTCRDDVTRYWSRGLSRDLLVSASDATQLTPGSMLQWRSYDWGLYKRNWNVKAVSF